MRLAASISRACDELYQFHPGDDTTVACMRIINSKPVHLMTGPARNPEDDTAMVEDFMSDPNAATIVCGGTSATTVAYTHLMCIRDSDQTPFKEKAVSGVLEVLSDKQKAIYEKMVAADPAK